MTLGVIRWLGPLVLAVVATWTIDRATARRGLTPPAFLPADAPVAALRRALAMTALAFVLFVGVFAPLGLIGLEPATGPIDLETHQLFQLHVLFMLALLAWYLLGFTGGTARSAGLDWRSAWRRQLGLGLEGAGRELALGAGLGLAAWLAVLSTLMLVGSLVYLIGGQDALPDTPPPAVVWVAGLPLAVRVGISLSAGIVEEVFFRGFLQPRIGIGLSTVFFVLAHMSYEQPLMLVGISLLSLIFAGLVRWRQSIWAAIAAHAVFDGIQLLFVIPQLLEFLEPGATGAAPLG